MDNVKSHTLHSRLLAFILALAMVIGVCPSVFAEDNQGVFYGDIVFKDASLTEVDKAKIGELRYLHLSISPNTDATANMPHSLRLYLSTNDGKKNVLDYINFSQFNAVGDTVEIGDYYYELCEDENGYYFDVTTVYSGSAFDADIPFKFKDGVDHGQKLVVDVRGVDYYDDKSVTRNDKAAVHAEIAVEVPPKKVSEKSANTDSLKLDKDATTLADNHYGENGEYSYPYLEYTIKVEDPKEQTGKTLPLKSYTVTDTFTLPPGLTIENFKEAYTITRKDGSTVNYDVTGPDVNGTYKITWTEPEEGRELSDKEEYTAKLDCGLVTVGEDYKKADSISNSSSVSYTWETSAGPKTDKTTKSSVETLVSPSGSALGEASKRLDYNRDVWVNGRALGDTSTTGYVTAGEDIWYGIRIKNDTEEYQIYHIVDDLSKYNLKVSPKNVGPQDAKIGDNIWLWTNYDYNWNTKSWETLESPIWDKDWNSLWYLLGQTSDKTKIDIYIKVAPGDTAQIGFYCLVDRDIPGENGLKAKPPVSGTVVEDPDGDYYEIVNEAEITVCTQEGTNNPAPTDESVDVEAPTVIQKTATPKLEMKKTANTASGSNYYKAGDTFTYTVTIENKGTADATRVEFKDTLPAGLEIVGNTYTIRNEATGTTETVTVKPGETSLSHLIGTIKPGEKYVIEIPVKVVGYKKDASSDTVTIPKKLANKAFATSDNNDPVDASAPDLYLDNSTVEGLDIQKTTNTNKKYYPGDEITYHIKVSNPNQGVVNESFTITDWPKGLKYKDHTNKEKVQLDTDNTVDTGDATEKLVFNITNANVSSAPYTQNCEFDIIFIVVAEAGVTLSNTAGIDGGKSSKQEGPTVESKSDVKLLVEKIILGSEEPYKYKEVGPGEEVTFRIKLTNNSTAPITQYKLEDYLRGKYAPENATSDNHKYTGTIKVYDNNMNPIPQDGWEFVGTGDTVHIKIEIGNGWDGKYIYDNDSTFGVSNMPIPIGESIYFEYTVRTSDVEGFVFERGSNEVDASMYIPSEWRWEEQGKDEVTLGMTTSLDLTKDADKTTVSVDTTSEDPIEAIKSAKFTYTVKLTNKDAEYKATGAYFEDSIPDDLELAYRNNNDKVEYGEINDSNFDNNKYNDLITVKVNGTEYKPSSGNVNIEYIAPAGKDRAKLKITFPKEITVPKGANIELTYSLKVKDSSAQKILNAMTGANGEDAVSDLKYKNEITFNGNGSDFKNGNGDKVGQITAVETVYLREKKICPGITKEVVATRTDITDETWSAFGSGNKVNVTDAILWKITIYNGSAAGEQMRNYHVADILPFQEKFYYFGDELTEEEGATKQEDGKLTIKVEDGHGKKTDLDIRTLRYDKNGNITGNNTPALDSKGETSETGEELSPPRNYNKAAGEFIFDESQSWYNDYSLNAGDRLEFYIVSKGPKGGEYGVYTNIAKLYPSQEIYKDSVVAGAYGTETVKDEDGTEKEVQFVEDQASIPIYGVNTTSDKTVYYNGESAHSFGGEQNNKLKAKAGATLTYELKVSNNSGDHIDNVTFIDKLPFSGDNFVSSDIDRGSVFPVKIQSGHIKKVILRYTNSTPYKGLKENDELVLVDSEQGIDTGCATWTYSSDGKMTFKPTYLDWKYGADNSETEANWDTDITDSTNLVRVILHDLDTIDDAKWRDAFYHTHVDENDSSVTYPVYGIPHGVDILVIYDAKIPDYIQNTGETHHAWNSFAYYFDAKNETNMVAEPARVGVWVPDEAYGAALLVQKIFKTNLPGVARDFYFALYEAKDEYADEKITSFDQLKESEDEAHNPRRGHLHMTGSRSGSQAEFNFTNLEYKRYYIVETDSNYVPLTAAVEQMQEDNYNKKKATSNLDEDGNEFLFTMDNTSQTSSKNKGNQDLCESIYLIWNKDLDSTKTYNSAIFTNEYNVDYSSEIMGPFYADVPTGAESAATEFNEGDGSNVLGGSAGMLSTRPLAFQEGKISTSVTKDHNGKQLTQEATKSTERQKANYDSEIDDYGYDVHQHTIATGFLARINGTGDFTVKGAKWRITSTLSNFNHTGQVRDDGDNAIYVRLRTERFKNAGTSGKDDETALLYLNDFIVDMFGDIDEGSLAVGDEMDAPADTLSGDSGIIFDGNDEVESIDDDIYFSQYTVEERAAIVAESLGIDPSNISWNDYGEPYVIMDEAVEEQAVYLSSKSEKNVVEPTTKNDVKTKESDFNLGESTPAPFADAAATPGYAIFRIPIPTHKTMADAKSAQKYIWEIEDAIPEVTLREGSTIYVGVIMDQLYDRNAVGELVLSKEAPTGETADQTKVAIENANGGKEGADGKGGNVRYTHVLSPSQNNNRVINGAKFGAGNASYVLSKGTYLFDPDTWGFEVDPSTKLSANITTKVEHSSGSIRINATAATDSYVNFKKSGIDITDENNNKTHYNGYLQLNGTGSLDARSVALSVNPNMTIKVIALSGSTTDRTLLVENKNGEEIAKLTAPNKGNNSTGTNYTFNTGNNSGTIYLRSNKSGINIFAIIVE